MTHLLGSDYFTPEFPLYVAQTQHSAIAPNRHDFFELVYLMSGRGTHYIGATGYTAFNSIVSYRAWIAAHFFFYNRHSYPVAPYSKLIDSRCAESIGSTQ